MRVAAYQAPLLPSGSMEALDLIRARVEQCEANGVSILCCPEAILGGLADDSEQPAGFAIAADRLHVVLAPIASDQVTTIIGFTEMDDRGRFHNTAAVFHRGVVTGLYRKLHPAINWSVYGAGTTTPVFQIGSMTFGIVICYDSTFVEPARLMAARGATVLFVPSNNGLPPAKGGPELVEAARNADISRSVENGMWVVRSDVAGHAEGKTSYGSTGIVDPAGTVRQSARLLSEDFVVADIG